MVDFLMAKSLAVETFPFRLFNYLSTSSTATWIFVTLFEEILIQLSPDRVCLSLSETRRMPSSLTNFPFAYLTNFFYEIYVQRFSFLPPSYSKFKINENLLPQTRNWVYYHSSWYTCFPEFQFLWHFRFASTRRRWCWWRC